MKKIILVFLILLFNFFIFAQEKSNTIVVKSKKYSSNLAEKILKKLDRDMYPEIFESKMEMITYRKGRKPLKYIYKIYSKGSDTALMKVIYPKRDKGKKILLKKDNLWMYIPSVSRPIRLTRKQSFMGSTFSNEDLLNSTLSDDYDPQIINKDKNIYLLILKAKRKDVAYAKIKMKIKMLKDKTLIPLDAVYYGLSGKPIKKMIFKDVKELGGKLRPAYMKMSDLLEEGAYTEVNILTMKKVKKLPEYLFNQTQMGR